MLTGALRYAKSVCSLAASGLAGFANAEDRERVIRFARRDVAKVPWKPSLPTISIAELGGADRAHLPVEDAADGNVSGLELIALAALAGRPGVRSIFEIGTFNGLTALNFALNSAADARVTTLDLPPRTRATRPCRRPAATSSTSCRNARAGSSIRASAPRRRRSRRFSGTPRPSITGRI